MTARLSWWRRHRPALVLFVIVFGTLYFVMTREYLSKKRVAYETLERTQVTTERPYELEWPKRRDGSRAPPLSLVIPVTAFANGMFGGNVEVPRLSTGHGRVYLFAGLPDPEGLSMRALGGCAAGLDSAECSVAELRLMLLQDAPDRDEPGHAVMESTPRAVSDAASSGPIRKLKAFWIREDRARGSLDFVGWDCDAGTPTGVPSTDPAIPLIERNRCFEPATLEERRAPQRHGYLRFVQLTACDGSGIKCKLYFPFRGRYVEVEPTRSPMTFASEQAKGHMFLAAWEFLNRLHRDSRKPPSLEVRLARANAHLENCRALHAMLPPAKRENFNERNALSQYPEFECGHAVHLAASVLEQRPAEANGVLQAAFSTLHFPAHAMEMRLREAALEAMRKAGVTPPNEVAQAKFEIARRMPGAALGSPGLEKRRAALEDALKTADDTLAPGSDTHLQIYAALSHSFYDEEADAKLAVLERWKAAVRQGHGPNDARLLVPVHQACSALEWARRAEPLKACADEYLPLWLDAAARETAPPFSSATPGLDLLRWYSAYGIVQKKPREVLPTMKKIAAILEPRVSSVEWAKHGATAIRYVEDRLPH